MKYPTPKVMDLILEYEVGGGKSYYEKYLSKPTWPGAASGFTLGIGVDCGYYTPTELDKMFSFLPKDQLQIVENASGKTGLAGKEYTEKYKNCGIDIPWDKALDIFDNTTWTKFAKLAEGAFPGLNELCDNAYGAIVSLVFNRGTSMKGDNRLEMRNIRVLVPKKDYKAIAEEIRKMKRLWEGKGLNGLVDRREAEAKLVESCA